MRRYPSPALLVLACGAVLVACTPAPQPPQTAAEAVTAAAAPATSATEPTPVAAASECPYPEFDTFLKHFGNEITLQEKATADPLLDSYIDAEAEPEPRKVESRLALADGQRQVQIRTPDSSDQQTYTFAQAPCWTLVKREDESI